MGLPTVTSNGSPMLLQLPGPSILKTPDGVKVPLTFRDDLWHLPVYAKPKQGKTARTRTQHSTRPPSVSANRYAALENDETEPVRHPVPQSACTGWTTADIDTSHQSWCHPGHMKYDSIICQYPDLFPRDPSYRTAARKHRCPVCDLMKGARAYRKSKRMKEKQRKKGGKGDTQRLPTIREHPESDAPTAIAQHGNASISSW
mmetsp:Transcript_37957/g.77885  ORF Transcript_37957/g.77885 Transcript_37957/m.77885 type:complete len:202 (-) Transcript_37957:863-1468(-)